MEDVKQTVVPAGPIASPSLVVYPRPFESGDRIDCYAAFLPGETLGAFMRRSRIAAPSRVVRVEHNGRPVPLALWDRLIPRQGDMVVVSARALGGGGGGKVLRTVAMLAVVAAAFYAPAFAGLTKMVGGIEVATLGGSALSAGIMLGGSLLVGAAAAAYAHRREAGHRSEVREQSDLRDPGRAEPDAGLGADDAGVWPAQGSSR